MGISEKYKRILKKIAGIAGLGAITLFNNGCRDNQTEPLPSESSKIEKVTLPKKVEKKVKNPVLSVQYHTDTLKEKTSIILYYLNRSITRNYVEGCNSYRLQMPYFVHEKWHEHNYDTGFRTRCSTSPKEYAFLCMHDEISANLAAILTMRYEYLAAQDKESVIKKYEKSYAGFYFKAIKNKTIIPNSTNHVEREKEYRFLANEVRDMWMKMYSPAYRGRIYSMVKKYIKRKGLIEDTKQTYKILRRKMYTIGGVEFDRYMEKDIDFYNDYVNIFENLRKVKCLQTGGKDILSDIEKNYHLVNTVDYMKQPETLQHILIAAQLKYQLRGIDSLNLKKHPQIITSCYSKVMKRAKADKTFAEFMQNTLVCHGMIIEQGEAAEQKYQNVMQQIYTLNGVDLRQEIENFNERNVPVLTKYNTTNITDMLPELQFNFSAGDFMFEPVEAGVIENLRNNSDAEAGNKVSVSPSPIKKKVIRQEYIDVPNFYEPILTSNTPQQDEAIYTMMQKFDSIPDVFKNCDSKAQQEYIRKQNAEKGR